VARSDSGRIVLQGVVSLVVALIAQAANPVVSRLGTGDFRVPRPVVLTVTIIAVAWAGVAFIRAEDAKRRKATTCVGPCVIPARTTTIVPVTRLKAHGVMWQVVRWESIWDSASFTSEARRSPTIVEVPPRCPQCDTELSQTYRFWGRWRWYCPNCDFSTIARTTFDGAKGDVGKIARARVG